MINLYHQISYSCSKLITHSYSTSFSIGIRALGKSHRDPIRAIYGFVRIADEIVDTFHDFDKKTLLEEFKVDTFKAIENKISTNPVLHAFQQVVHKYNINHELIHAFLYSMEMDLYYTEHPKDRYDEYIYGSAEVVGLMCLYVFCDGNKIEYEKLKPYAQSLGAAFQKINFLRDLKSDVDDRGRIYFPNLSHIKNFDYSTKKAIEEDIEKDFAHALKGIQMLPRGSKLGVYIAYVYFYQLLQTIKKLKPKAVTETRIRISDPHKIWLLVQSWFQFRLNLL